ncbi:thioredoxin family protein [Flavobacterium luminosum]|uniref:Thioredoxin family protein n=1 Tax=Flavobacterium luminosum TaxID=2949086 RepID=A0ABT0TQI6_9FLAO|nr:thioredoxin family protein [Flavobacterium sp. HXWNR70]MCL9809324.1 thioredoxin family protein [Flavobacterium sp. HXWNR70]
MKNLKYLLLLLPALLIFSFTENVKPVESLKWHTNVKEAAAVAQKTNKPMLLFFTGSDWCGWCIRLQKEVFKTPEFEKWATDNVVLVELDFPRRVQQSNELKMQNAQLQQVFGIRGYPTVWIVKAKNNNGNINFEQLGSTGYVAGGPNAWLAGANQMVAKFEPYTKKEQQDSKKSK